MKQSHFSRRGSMQLSIEAIIILVIAMVLLGLGIAFVSGFFKEGTTKLKTSFDAVEFGCDPSSSDPLKIIPKDITVGPDTDAVPIKVCYYHSQNTAPVKIMLDTQCAKEGATPNSADLFKFTASPQTINKGDAAGYNIIISKKDSVVTAGSYICTIVAKHNTAVTQYATKQTVIVVI